MMPDVDLWNGADTILDQSACPICYSEMCLGHDADEHERPSAEAEARPASPLAVLSADAVIEQPPPIAIVEGVAYKGCVTVLVAESSGGKTFTLLDMSAAVSAGRAWHGRRVLRGSIAFCSYEGDALGLRLRAIRDVQGYPLDHVHVIRASDPLSPHVTREGEQPSIGEIHLRQTLTTLRAKLDAAGEPPIVLVVIDTIRASLSGSEDNSEPVSAYLRSIRRLLACVPEAAGLLAHHAGWQDGEGARKRERGSSAWRGNGDATLYLEAGEYDAMRGEAPLTLRALKVRDAERPMPLALIRRRVELDILDRDGRPHTSCIIVADPRTAQDHEAARREALQAADRATDLRVLRAMRDHATATSVRTLRAFLGLGAPVVEAAVSRLLAAGWAVPGRRGQPYQVTPLGQHHLDGYDIRHRTTPNDTECHTTDTTPDTRPEGAVSVAVS